MSAIHALETANQNRELINAVLTVLLGEIVRRFPTPPFFGGAR